MIAQAVHVAARLGVADHLVGVPLSAESLARKVEAHAPSLYRVMRLLASLGLFSEDRRSRFKVTAFGRMLCSDHPASMRNFSMMSGQPYNYAAATSLHHGVATGESPFQRAHGMHLFEYLGQHPHQARLFSAAMASISAVDNPAVAAAYPFGTLGEVVDVGGAHGHLLAVILRRYRKLRGVLYDLPEVVSAAAQSGFLTEDLSERCRTIAGSFFDSVPTGADAYLIKNVLHDWDDEKCVTILKNCRAAMKPGGRVLIAERMIAKGKGAFASRLYDVIMMTMTPGGRERTRKEFQALFRQAGLRLTRVIPTSSPMFIVEARPQRSSSE
jgi:hypothetical protein